jgi:hypothetical protein
MSYTAPGGSTWQVTSNYDINPTSGYYRAYAGEFRGSPNNNPQNDVQQSCSFACDSKPDCAGWALDGNGSHCYIINGNVKTLRSFGGRKAYVRTSARPTGKYATTAQGVTLSTVGGHYCQGDGWAGDGEGMEVQNSGGNRYCIENFPRPSRCPADLGAPVTGNIVNKTNGAGVNYATGTNNTGIICTYNSIPESIVWNGSKMGTYFQGNDTTGTIQQIKSDTCAPKSFNDLFQPNNNCIQFYNAQSQVKGVSGKTERSNAELLARIVVENNTNWPDNDNMRNTILAILLDNGPSSSSALTMLTNYCLPTNPWPDNDKMRTFINELIDPLNPTQSNPTLAAAAVGFAAAYCRQNPTSPHCGCWNAAQLKQYAGCIVDANKDLPGCGGLYDLHGTFKAALAASPSLASVITPIENAIKPVCFAAECKACASSSADVNLRTGSTQTCTDNINICLQNVTVRGDMKGTLNQACNINLNPSTPAAPNTGGIPTSLQTTTDGAGTATVNASSGPDAAASATSNAVSTVSRTVDGKKVEIDELIIKPGKSAFVDKYLPTPEKQKMAIGACVVLIVILFLALIFGGDDTPQQNPMEMQAMMLRAQLGL